MPKKTNICNQRGASGGLQTQAKALAGGSQAAQERFQPLPAVII